ncbi:MAG: PP2C family protein-serine/threonine phosphatase, partial [Chloroflexota bacterium]
MAQLVSAFRKELDSLANAWLAEGAHGVWLLHGRQVLASWGEGDLTEITDTKRMQLDKRTRLDWAVASNRTSAQVEARLQVDVTLIERLFHMDAEINALSDELVNTQDQLLTIMDLSQFTRAYLDVEPVLRVLTLEAMTVVEAESAFSIVNNPDGTFLAAQYPERRNVKPLGMQLFQDVEAESRPVLLGSEDVPFSFVNALMVPIMVDGEIVGGMGFFDAIDGFPSPKIKLASAVAELAGQRLEGIMLYQQNLNQARLQTEMDLAWQVQSKLMPKKVPDMACYDVYATYKPALTVSGDFYDFIPHSEQGYLLALGDVSGKGVSAAMVMTMIHTALRSASARHPRLNDLLETVNAETYDDFTELDVFATLFVGWAQPEDNRFSYINAGHSPVILCRAGGDTEMLEADGPPVGILPMSMSEQQTLDMMPGDVLVIATDGFSEAENFQGEMFGYERLMACIADARNESAQTIAHVLFNAIEQFTHGTPTQTDDQTILVVKRWRA